jgi:hypothetical protein
MATEIPGRFAEVQFTDEERNIAKRFHPLNILLLKDHRAKIVNLKLNIKFDPEHTLHFAQEESYLAGKLAILDELIGDQEN